MTQVFRIAFLLDPVQVLLDKPWALRVRWEDHAQALGHELVSAGHEVRTFGVPRMLLPRGGEVGLDDGELDGKKESGASLENFRPDVIVAYESRSSSALRGARMATKLGAGFCVIEPAWIDESTPARWFSALGRRVWGGIVKKAAHRLVALDPLAFARSVDAGFSEDRVDVVPYGIDLSQYRPGLTTPMLARHGVRGRLVLYVGRLLPDRDLTRLIRAYAKTTGQRSDWSLVLAGEGPEESRLRQEAGRAGIADRVFFLPAPKPAELPGLLGAAAIFAFPALGDAVTSRQVGRALACGLPVLVSNHPRLVELVEDGVSGLHVRQEDEGAWEEALGRATSAPEVRKRWSRAAREFAERELGWQVIGRRFARIFECAVKGVDEERPSGSRRPA